MPTSRKIFTGTGRDGYVTIYKNRYGQPLARKAGGGLMIPHTEIFTNIFEDLGEININFVIVNDDKEVKKIEVVTMGTKLKELRSYNPERRHYIYVEEGIELLITKEQVLLNDCIIVSR